MSYHHTIRLGEFQVDLMAMELESQANSAESADVDSEDLAIDALLEPYEALIEKLGLKYGVDCESTDTGYLNVTFEFDSAQDASEFKPAVRAANLP